MSYDLTKLGYRSFEHLVNFLILKTLGSGGSSFGPGPDGGRDGFFEGEAPYPSPAEHWKGVWYIQCKFHEPHLTTNAQTWLVSQLEKELQAFEQRSRKIPDNLILATNIDPSGAEQTGAFDRCRSRVVKFSKRHRCRVNFHIWGGNKILQLLARNSDVSTYYRHLLTPGHVLTQMHDSLSELTTDLKCVTEYLVVNQFVEQQYMKLDQAGSSADTRPGIQDLFIDVPFFIDPSQQGLLLDTVVKSAQQCHRHSLRKTYPDSWQHWNARPERARVMVIKGGPGQGKSTIGQYFCQSFERC